MITMPMLISTKANKVPMLVIPPTTLIGKSRRQQDRVEWTGNERGRELDPERMQ